jgi:hypothetical protein
VLELRNDVRELFLHVSCLSGRLLRRRRSDWPAFRVENDLRRPKNGETCAAVHHSSKGGQDIPGCEIAPEMKSDRLPVNSSAAAIADGGAVSEFVPLPTARKE